MLFFYIMSDSPRLKSSLFLFLSFGNIRNFIWDTFGNKGLRILVITNSLILLAGAMLGPIQAIFVDKVGGDLMDAGIAGGIFSLVAGLTVLISGSFTDKLKELELVVVIGYIIMAFGFLSYLLVNSTTTLFIVQAVVGFGDAIYNPAFDALYSKHIDQNKSGSQWGLWEATNYFTASTGAIAGGIIAKNFGLPLFLFSWHVFVWPALSIFTFYQGRYYK